MKLNQKVAQVVESGIEPICLKYETARFFTQGAYILRSFLSINSLEIGVLNYDQYRFVAARSKQSEQLLRCHVTKLFRAITKSPEQRLEVSCYTMPVYARALRDGVLSQMLFEGFAQFPDVSPSMICVEISADVLYEDIDWLKSEVDKIRALGVKVALCEVGDEFCPMFRLSSIDFDYAFLDPHVISLIQEDGSAFKWLVDFLHSKNARVIAPLIDSEDIINDARKLDCDGYISADSISEEVDEI